MRQNCFCQNLWLYEIGNNLGHFLLETRLRNRNLNTFLYPLQQHRLQHVGGGSYSFPHQPSDITLTKIPPPPLPPQPTQRDNEAPPPPHSPFLYGETPCAIKHGGFILSSVLLSIKAVGCCLFLSCIYLKAKC
jgi:hypothetical protein